MRRAAPSIVSSSMESEPWLGDSCSLVDAFRAGDLSPSKRSTHHLARLKRPTSTPSRTLTLTPHERARWSRYLTPIRRRAMAIKELESVAGWPSTEASLVYRDRVASYDSTQVTRLRAAGAVLAAQTTASEFGGINCTSTKLHGTTRNPWNLERTPAAPRADPRPPSPAASSPSRQEATAVARFEFRGLHRPLGLKSTFGRIPRGPTPNSRRSPSPSAASRARCVILRAGLIRATALTARHPKPSSRERWEANLDSFDLAGKRAVISIDLGSAVVEPVQSALLIELAEFLITKAQLIRVDLAIHLPTGPRVVTLELDRSRRGSGRQVSRLPRRAHAGDSDQHENGHVQAQPAKRWSGRDVPYRRQ